MLLLCLTCWTVNRCDKKYELTLNILNWVSRSLLLAQLIDNMTSCCTILEKPGSYLQTSRNYSPEYITPWILPLSVYSIIYHLCLFCFLITWQKPPSLRVFSLYCCDHTLDQKWRCFGLASYTSNFTSSEAAVRGILFSKSEAWSDASLSSLVGTSGSGRICTPWVLMNPWLRPVRGKQRFPFYLNHSTRIQWYKIVNFLITRSLIKLRLAITYSVCVPFIFLPIQY